VSIRHEYLCNRTGCPSLADGIGQELPKDWLAFELHGYLHHFCSVPCLRMTLNLWDKLGYYTELSDNIFICDECRKEILLKPRQEWPVWVEVKGEGFPQKRLGFCSVECMAGHLRCVTIPAMLTGMA
jgi:hypothetical protein